MTALLLHDANAVAERQRCMPATEMARPERERQLLHGAQVTRVGRTPRTATGEREVLGAVDDRQRLSTGWHRLERLLAPGRRFAGEPCIPRSGDAQDGTVDRLPGIRLQPARAV